MLGLIVFFILSVTREKDIPKTTPPESVSYSRAIELSSQRLPVFVTLGPAKKGEKIEYDRSIPKNRAEIYLAYLNENAQKNLDDRDFTYLARSYVAESKKEYLKLIDYLKKNSSEIKKKGYRLFKLKSSTGTTVFVFPNKTPVISEISGNPGQIIKRIKVVYTD